MNIAMVQSTPYPPEEGIGNYVSNLSDELTNRGHSVTVITRGGLEREKTWNDGIRVVRIPCPPVYPFHVDVHGALVNRYLDRAADQFDLVHSHTPLTPVIRSHLPLVTTVHTSVVEDIKHVYGWSPREAMSRVTYHVSSRRLVANQADNAERITTVSERVGGELAEHYDIDDATVVHNGVDAERFQPGAHTDDRYVLFVGRLDYPKGVPDLLEAAESIVESHDIEFVITGKGPQRDQLEQQAKRIGIENNVTFTGYVPRARQIQLYQNATAFALPSHYEGLPTVLLEAMSCGAPVVATTVGGCPEVINDRENGLLAPPEDPPALSNAIDMVLSDPELRNRMSGNARQTILNRFTWEKITDRFEREYRLATGTTRAMQ
ncbi:glycosyltransferase family 4 protein (plasmid) [Haloarcula sp. NS06]|uniref:glycosyltransferase family 4 protein n=1 Tax=Haloarcula sp. NS06 TaxID=3409688 RepID=UPI003DA791A8